MTLFPRLTAFTVATLIAAAPPATQAGEGHDHGEAPATPTGQALPRFAATSDTFELVGVLDGHDLTLWLDHAADNSPVEGASLELEIGGVKVEAEQHEAGEFEAELAEEPEEGEVAIKAKVVVGQRTELLSGDLDIHHEEHAEESASGASWGTYGAWGAGGLVLLALLGWAMRRARVAPRHS
ncbi:hypothetical protein KRX52_10230 [Pseudomonas sp. MAP12]|jgi:hypothetical protein|uniref:Uncharacterized protein n=1 Tax=Geopseudomonas aromaticivorans TaxID=2849492 RepID=A0ABS6MWK4_9GAMM|nr:hypothetical protein [Pseudomonas aromaticivorans]MBV2133179.1 hypothetical protein [Pseudomonas aromaticivorans]MCM2319356.1 hypothetical protein [Pseudomonas sp.]